MSAFPKLIIHSEQPQSQRCSLHVFAELDELILKFVWKCKGPVRTKKPFTQVGQGGSSYCSGNRNLFENYRSWLCAVDTRIDGRTGGLGQWAWKGQGGTVGAPTSPQTVLAAWTSVWENLCLILNSETYSGSVVGWSVKGKVIKYLEDNTQYLRDLGIGKSFLNKTLKAQMTE